MMVAEFKTSGHKYSFKIDGKAYTLPQVTYAQIERFADEEDSGKRINLMHDIMFSRASKRTAEAIGSLTPEQVGVLFRKYMGMTPGESSASAE